jgi:carbamoyl-phosphate synthase large subunit
MRAGETDSAVTVSNERLEALGETLGRSLGHLGNLDCDVFLNAEGAWVLELNPRFGGGYPFSHVAGANLPAALIAWARGEAPDPRWLRPEVGVVSSKFSRLMLIRQR